MMLGITIKGGTNEWQDCGVTANKLQSMHNAPKIDPPGPEPPGGPALENPGEVD